MGTIWSFEKSRTFSVPYEKLFQDCERALTAMNLKTTRLDVQSGILEAEKPAKWPFKSRERISVTVSSDSKIKAVAKLDLGSKGLSALPDMDLINERFFRTLQEII